MSTNLFRFIREINPQPTLQIATVLSVNGDNTSTIEYPDGSQQVARGTSVSVGSAAFVRNGVIEGVAPARVAVTGEI